MVCQATAIAKEPSTVIRISRSLFRKMLEGYPAAAVTLRDIMAKRLDNWQRELAARESEDGEGRRERTRSSLRVDLSTTATLRRRIARHLKEGDDYTSTVAVTGT